VAPNAAQKSGFVSDGGVSKLAERGEEIDFDHILDDSIAFLESKVGDIAPRKTVMSCRSACWQASPTRVTA
jgi:hypothetical protein